MDDHYAISTVAEAGGVRIQLAGDIDLVAVPAIASEIDSALTGDASAIRIDLSKVTFIDSSGIGALLTGLHRATEAGRAYTAAGAHGLAERVLTIAGVADYLADPETR
ncbi:MAG TPA: STAS domain-containing protein [Micromonosporaceae bacterium]